MARRERERERERKREREKERVFVWCSSRPLVFKTFTIRNRFELFHEMAQSERERERERVLCGAVLVLLSSRHSPYETDLSCFMKWLRASEKERERVLCGAVLVL